MSKVVYFDVFDKIKMLKRAGIDLQPGVEDENNYVDRHVLNEIVGAPYVVLHDIDITNIKNAIMGGMQRMRLETINLMVHEIKMNFDPLDQDLIEIWWLGDSNISSGAINIDYLDDYNE